MLPVAVFKSDSPTPAPDPIVYLSGGPGENALKTVELNFNTIFAPYLATRDLIMFDQRGTGSSNPALNCPEIKEFLFENLTADTDLQTFMDQSLDSYRRCYDRLSAEGVNFAVYNSAQNAADVAMLRVALGYEEWNLLGASYGTRLAQTILRDNDAGVRSVVLDSVYPLEVNLQTDTPANLKRAMDLFFAMCAADETCSTEYPDLETVFWDLVAEYNETPFLLTTADIFTGERREVLTYGDSLIRELFRALYQPEMIELLPRLIFNLRNGDTDLLARISSRSLSLIDFVSTGMQISVQCREEIYFTDPDEEAAAVAEFEEFGTTFISSSMTGLLGLDICEFWQTGTPDAKENEPVTSDIPTLIVHGELDPITPPFWGRQVAERFDKAFFFEYPAQAHGPGLISACARRMVLEFIDNPQEEPDRSCMAGLGGIDFAVPVTAEMVRLVPYANDLFGTSGLIPEGWTEAGPGVHTKWGNVILQQAVRGMAANQLAYRLISRLGMSSLPEPQAEVETGAFTWTVYQFNIEIPGEGEYEIDMALTETNDTAYLVLLQSSPADYAGLHEGVFTPVLNALTVP